MAPPLVVFVLGGPGAGKGTQCERILAEFKGWGHVSAGDCLRAERNNPDSKDGQMINDYIKEGKIVPSEITVRLMKKAMDAAEGKTKFLIDGFPRDLGNVTTWERVIGDSAKVVGVFFFDCSEETMEGRLLERGKTSGRVDDNIESIRKRFKTFKNESMPIIEKYKATEGLLTRFDAAPPADDVWKAVQAKVRQIESEALKRPEVVFVLGGPGAGKGTQCERILSGFDGWGHVSAGDCLRAERNNPESKDGQLINDRIKEGKIVPSEITVRLMLKAMNAAKGKTKFLIDGFPRDVGNVTTWEKVVGDSAKLVGVFFFDCSEETMEARLLERGKTSGRVDDNIESIRKRFKTFKEESMPIIENYKESGLVTRFDAAPPAGEVWKAVQAKVSEIEKKPEVIFVLGGPGAGKGTQCDKILSKFDGWGHVSAGDCLRAERNNPKSKDGQLINDCIKEGRIVPSEITVRLMQKAMVAAEGKDKFLIDGFPRNLGNVTTWEKVIGDSAILSGVFFFDCSEQTMEGRLLERGKTSGRVDDNMESIRKRFKTFHDESMPIIEKYKQTAGLVTRFDAAPAAEDVWKVVEAKVGEIETVSRKRKRSEV